MAAGEGGPTHAELAEQLIALSERLDEARRRDAGEQELERITAELEALLERIRAQVPPHDK
jgi:hypothetical protein